MPAFTFEKLPAPPRPDRTPPAMESRSSFNRLLDRFAVTRLRRAAALLRRDAGKTQPREPS